MLASVSAMLNHSRNVYIYVNTKMRLNYLYAWVNEQWSLHQHGNLKYPRQRFSSDSFAHKVKSTASWNLSFCSSGHLAGKQVFSWALKGVCRGGGLRLDQLIVLLLFDSYLNFAIINLLLNTYAKYICTCTYYIHYRFNLGN